MQPTRSPVMRQGMARVKLPLPGSGKASKVKDITAGTGQSDAHRYPNIGNEPFTRGNVVSSPASCPSPIGVRSVHTPTLMRSLHRSNSAREYRSLLGRDRSELASFEVLPSECPEESYNLNRDVSSFEQQRSHSCEPVVESVIHTPSARSIVSREAKVEAALADLPRVVKSPSEPSISPERSPRVLADLQSQGPSEPKRPNQRQVSTPNGPRNHSVPRDAAKVRATSARRSSSKESGRRGVAPSRPVRAPANDVPLRHRTQSEPPLPKGAHGRMLGRPRNRLVQLVAEVGSHLHGLEAHLPKEGSTWLQEIAQLELYVEEMQWLIDRHESGSGGFANEANADDVVAKHQMSVLRGDKDIRWVRQQLRLLEQEHAHLVQRLNCVDPSAQEMQAAELRAVEEEIIAEQKRQKQLVIESRQREKSLVQYLVDGRETDAKTKTLQQIDRLEGELAVWKVKNSSLNKQVQEATQLLHKAQDQQHALDQRAQHMGDALVSEQHAMRQVEQRQAHERVQSELASLQETIAELQEGRDRALKNHQRHKREHGRELTILSDTCKDLEAQERHLDTLERQLQRQVRQLALQALT